MPNTLGFYNAPLFAANMLAALTKTLGMANRVYMAFDRERRTYNRGDTINITRPGNFIAQDAPGAAQDIVPDSVVMVLNQWKEVRLAVTDKELAYSGQEIINDHITRAAYAVADNIDQALNQLAKDIPWKVTADGTTPIKDFTNAWQRLFDNLTPQDDLHMEINGSQTNLYLQQPAFSQWQGAGQVGVDTQLRGTLGQKFGFEVFSNQNVVTQTDVALGTVTQLQLNAAASSGSTTLVIKDSDGVLTGTIAKGDSLLIAGSPQQYAVTADASASANLITVTVTPPLVKNYSANDNVTLTQTLGKALNLAFHRQAFALAFAKLPDFAGAGPIGASFASIQDPVTGIAVRYRIGYDNDNSRVVPVVDVLYGVKTLNPNMAVRIES